MSLEDHVGDIIRKARAGLGVASQPGATAAAITAEHLNELENTGHCPSQPDFSQLAQLLGLHAEKLSGIANGWTPSTPDLDQWRELRTLTTHAQDMDVHSYLVWDEVTREAALFDTGWNAKPALEMIQEEQLTLAHVFITHGHPDHIGGLEGVQQAHPKVRLHMDNPGALPQHKNRRNDCIHLGSLRITNRVTCGHADDGVTYLVGNWPEDAPHVAIVGDAIFAGSMGGAPTRYQDARTQVREQILTLPDETLICPGHGPMTTVAEEKAHNPFF